MLKIKEYNIKSLVGILWKILVFIIKLILKVFWNNYKGLIVLDFFFYVFVDIVFVWIRYVCDLKFEEYFGKS